MSVEAEVPSQFTHSIKLSETAKGIRVDVHVYANDQGTAVKEALETYQRMKTVLESSDIKIAPFEVEKK